MGFAADATVNDAAAPPVDAGHATPDAGQIDVGFPARCGDGMCQMNEDCNSCAQDCGSCACEVGFVLRNQRCVPNAPAPFDTRTEAEICARWSQDHFDLSGEWTPTPGSTDMCDPGTLSQEGHDNAIRRTNLYRWLSALDPVGEDTARRDTQQACAVVQKAMGRLSHTPPPETPCYTPEGAAGARSSNIAFGGRNLAFSVDLYVGDRGVPSLGHRRWVLNPYMAVTAFGYKPPFSCMYSFSQGNRQADVDVVTWPPPGYVPARAARGKWSITTDVYVPQSSTRVEIALDDGPFEEVPTERPSGGFGWGSVIAFDPPGNASNAWRAGVTARVRLLDTRGGDFEYTTRFVDCP